LWFICSLWTSITQSSSFKKKKTGWTVNAGY
jgi:hypothetical protein